MNKLTFEQERNGIRQIGLRNRIEQRRGFLSEAQDARIRRMTIIRQVKEFAEQGKIAMVNSGMDCDCSRWENSVSVIRATVESVDKWVDDFYKNAEGPQSYRLERPSVAKKLQRSSRDLALEAFEDGHQHVVFV